MLSSAGRVLVGVLVVAVVLPAAAGDALAKARKGKKGSSSAPRIGIVHFDGPVASKVEATVRKVLTPHHLVTVVVADGPAPDDGPGEDGKAREACAQANLRGVISGMVEVKKKKKIFTATIFLRDGADGGVVAQKSFSGKGAGPMLRAVKKGTWKAFSAAIHDLPQATPPAPEEPSTSVKETPAAPPPPVASADEPSPASSPSTRKPPSSEGSGEVVEAGHVTEETIVFDSRKPLTGWTAPQKFEVAIGPRFDLRNFSYRNVPAMPLNEFRAQRPSGALGFAGTWLPMLARPRLGVTVEGEYGARAQASTADAVTHEMRSNEVVASALAGLPFQWGTLDLLAGGGLQQTKFVAVEEGAPANPLPDVDYRFLRAGLALRVYTGTPFSVSAQGAYRHVLNAGAIASEDWFPNLTVAGYEAGLGASYRVLSWLEVRLRGDWRRYRFHLNTSEGDPHVAGGAVDEYWGAWLGVTGLFGGGNHASPL